MDSRNNPKGNRRLKVGRQKKRVPHREAPVANSDGVAVTHHRVGKVVATQQLDQGHIAGRIDGNKVRGHIPVAEVLAQFERGRTAFGR